MFESKAVKDLMEQSGQIGNLHGMAYMGDLSADDLASVISHAATRERLRNALTTAAAEVGLDKATKKALRSARIEADAYVFVRGVRGSDKTRVEDDAEAAVKSMIIGDAQAAVVPSDAS